MHNFIFSFISKLFNLEVQKCKNIWHLPHIRCWHQGRGKKKELPSFQQKINHYKFVFLSFKINIVVQNFLFIHLQKSKLSKELIHHFWVWISFLTRKIIVEKLHFLWKFFPNHLSGTAQSLHLQVALFDCSAWSKS